MQILSQSSKFWQNFDPLSEGRTPANFGKKWLLTGGGKEGAVQEARSSGLRSWRELDLYPVNMRESCERMMGRLHGCCRIDTGASDLGTTKLVV